MAISWFTEASDLKPDPVSGATITRLTSAPCISSNIYCEQPYNGPDSRRIAIARTWGIPNYNATTEIFIADLETIRLTAAPGVSMGNNAAWGEWFYYLAPGKMLMALSLVTLEHRVVLSHPKIADFSIGAIAPNDRYMISTVRLPGPTIGIQRVDLQTGAADIILEDPEITNPHLQFNPIHSRQILVQQNTGSRMAADGTIVPDTMGRGCTLFVIDADGTNRRPLPVGEPWTRAATGHECFLADTGRVLFTVHWNWKTGEMDPRYPTGNLFTALPGDAEPTVFHAPEHRFNHVCASRCGRYFLADSYGGGLPGPVPLIIGNLATGKYRTLIENCQATCGGPQFTHPHAYLTADTKRVVWQADPFGITQIFKAEIPDGFLASLD